MISNSGGHIRNFDSILIIQIIPNFFNHSIIKYYLLDDFELFDCLLI